MKRFCLFGLTLLTIAVLTSCVTQREVSEGEKLATLSPISFSDENVAATASFSGGQWVNLSMENKTDKVITFVTDLASYSSSNGSTSKLVPEGTKYIDAKKEQSPVPIAPKGKYNKSFFSADAVYYLSNVGWESNTWIPNSLEGSQFIFAYKINGEEKYIVFDGNKSTSTLPKASEILGSVKVEKTFWNPLFLKSKSARQAILYKMAMEEATNKYGKNVTLKNLDYEGNWNAASLLLYFSMLGFVEDASLSADVVRTNFN